MMISKVISGGQTGVDQAALRAAKHVGIPTGGTAPRGFFTERGHAQSLLRSYGLVEDESIDYRPRTRKNIVNADATLILADMISGGSRWTMELCRKLGKPHRCFNPFDRTRILQDNVVEWIEETAHDIGRPIVLNVAGRRESKSPGIGDRTEDLLIAVFEQVLEDAEA